MMRLANSVRTMVGVGLVAALLSASQAQAQDPSLKPTFGTVTVKTGFTPDPFVKKLTAGGPIKTKLGGVASHVANAPDFRFNYTAGNVFPLTFHVRSAGDTTLLINLPNGTWIANDDGGAGLNPRLHLKNPPSGQYDIWVGTYGKTLVPATLYITELKDTNVDPKPKKPVTSSPLDISMKPRYGQANLTAGFLPDPHSVKLQAGGNIKTTLGNVTSHVMKNPDFKLFYKADGRPLTFYVSSSGDTTLLINLPNGQWVANDDGGKGLNAQLKLTNPQSGRYDIYVGTFRAETPIPAVLRITELK